jgi:ATP-dependent 26S proteasome regulatory subunit
MRKMIIFLYSHLIQAIVEFYVDSSDEMNLTRGINLRKIAEMMPGASGAEVKLKKSNFY